MKIKFSIYYTKLNNNVNEVRKVFKLLLYTIFSSLERCFLLTVNWNYLNM